MKMEAQITTDIFSKLISLCIELSNVENKAQLNMVIP